MKPVSNRYKREELIYSLDSGYLYKGKDLSLQRTIFIYAIPSSGQAAAQSYIQQIGNSAHMTNSAPFMHVFDVERDHAFIYVIMKYMKGTPLQHLIHSHSFSFEEALTFVAGMGHMLMEIAEERPIDFSLSPANLWVGDDDRQLVLLNTWDKSDQNQRLSKELSCMFYRLAVRREQAPADTESMRHALNQSQLLQALPYTHRKAVILTLIQAYEERLSALSFIQRLKELQQAPNEQEMSREVPYPYAADAADAANAADAADSDDPSIPERESGPTGSVLTTFKQAFFRKLVWKRISLTLSLALLSGVIFIGAFALLIETTGHKESPSKLAASAGNRTETAPTVVIQEPKPVKLQTTKEPLTADEAANVVVPSLTGLTKEAAEKQALASGLRYTFYLETNPVAAGTVFKQEPMPNEETAKGSRVTFWISKGSGTP